MTPPTITRIEHASPTLPAAAPEALVLWVADQYRAAVARVDPGFALPDGWARLPSPDRKRDAKLWETFVMWCSLADARRIPIRDYFEWRLKPSRGRARRLQLLQLISAVDLDRWCGLFRRVHEITHAPSLVVTQEHEELMLRNREAAAVAAGRPFLNRPTWYAAKRDAEGGHPLDIYRNKGS